MNSLLGVVTTVYSVPIPRNTAFSTIIRRHHSQHLSYNQITIQSNPKNLFIHTHMKVIILIFFAIIAILASTVSATRQGRFDRGDRRFDRGDRRFDRGDRGFDRDDSRRGDHNDRRDGGQNNGDNQNGGATATASPPKTTATATATVPKTSKTTGKTHQ